MPKPKGPVTVLFPRRSDGGERPPRLAADAKALHPSGSGLQDRAGSKEQASADADGSPGPFRLHLCPPPATTEPDRRTNPGGLPRDAVPEDLDSNATARKLLSRGPGSWSGDYPTAS
jgi:hypothetical protein